MNVVGAAGFVDQRLVARRHAVGDAQCAVALIASGSAMAISG
jgi:hypothetical protein